MHPISLPQQRVHDHQTQISDEARITPHQTGGWVRLVERLARGVFSGLAVDPRPLELEDELRI